MEELFAKIREAFADYDDDELVDLVKEALEDGIEPTELISVLSSCLEVVGEEFSAGNLFLPDMVMAGEQMELCMNEIRPVLEKQATSIEKGAKVVLGTVSGDIHDIGKNMVKAMLTVAGFDVVDLGTDVNAAQFYNAVVSEKPQILALSSCMTTTIPSIKDTVELLQSKGLDKNMRIVVGGGSMNENMAEQFGGCIYGGDDAFAAAKILKTLV